MKTPAETTTETPAVELAAEPGPLPFACLLDTATDDEAYAALPECTACEGTGRDDHGTAFEAPLAVHFAAPHVEIGGRCRQLCLWCGHVLLDVPDVAVLLPGEPYPAGALLRIEDGLATVVAYSEGEELPPGCCALPDEGEPVCICAVDGHPCPDCRDDEDQADDEPEDELEGADDE